jgi:uncharacterized membrane protein YgcG
VATASKEEELNLGTVATDAKLTGEAELTIGTDATAAAGVAKGAFSSIAGSMGFLGGLLSLTNIHVIPDGGTINGKHVNYIQNARGGTNLPTGWSLVGEEGPEFIHLKGGETILPHGTSPTSSSSPTLGGGMSSSSGGSDGGGGLARAINNLAAAFASHTHPIYMNGDLVGGTLVQQMRAVKGIRA